MAKQRLSQEKAEEWIEKLNVELIMAPEEEECTKEENEIYAELANLCQALKNNVSGLISIR